MNLRLRSDGADDSPVVVLLHSIATSSAMWAPQVPVLARQSRVVRVDLPGHGASEPLRTTRFAEHADAVVESLTASGIDRFTVVGLSMGAMVAAQVAARHAPRVDGVVLACAGIASNEHAAQLWRDRIAAVESGGIESQIEQTLARWFTPEFAAQSPHTLGWIRSMIAQTGATGFVDAATAIAQLDQRAVLAQIDADCLVIAGRHDKAVPPEAVRAVADAVPGARFESVDAAHLANVEAPVAFTELVAEFVGRS